MDKIYIIDAVNFLFRSYYAIGPMTNPQGESTSALFGFIRSVFKLAKDFSPSHLVAVFDGPDNKKKRQAIYADYKTHRKAMPEDLFPQIERAMEFCKIAGIPYLCVDGVEADDTMGSVAKWAEKKHAKAYLCTTDKDLCQLVNAHISVLNVHKDNLIIDRKGVKEIHGVYPEQITDYLGMIGDASDNIPGLEGFGPKTAAALLEEYGTLEKVLANADNVPGQKKQETLKRDQQIALMSKELAQLDLDVEFPHEESFFQFHEPDLEKVRAFYQEMRFLSLLKDLEQPKASEAHHFKEEKDLSYTLVDTPESLEALIETLKKEKEVCLDTETTDTHPMRAELVGIGFGIDPKTAWYVPLNGKLGKEHVLKALGPLFKTAISFYGHNFKYDLHVLLNEGIEVKHIAFDTMLASYLINPQNQRHNLDQLALEKFGKVKIPIEELIGKGKKQILMSEVPIDKVAAYCCEDVDYTCRLKELFEKELEKAGLNSVFYTIEVPLIPVLLKMERNGIYVDVKKLGKMSEVLATEIESLEKKIHHLAGESFNLNSPKQMSKILFEKMGIKPPKKTMTGFSTSADVLETLQESSPIVKEILEYRTLEKLRSTYIDALPDQILPSTHRIHCTFNQSVAATGRLSCQDPNLQNIPVRSEAGKKIREAFKPEHPHTSFLSADYSQIELRILAHLSQEPILLKAFNEGEDIHAFTASLVFDVPLKHVTPDMRHKAKAVNFGILYGQQAFGLSQGLGIEYKEAAAFIDAYFQRYKKVKEFLEFCKESVRKTGRAVTITGRHRPIPEIDSKNGMLRAAAERLAINTPLQGTSADIIKMAMISIDSALNEEKMLLQIHDELLFEVFDSQVDKLSKLVKREMENVVTLKVPLVVDISIGKNWGEC